MIQQPSTSQLAAFRQAMSTSKLAPYERSMGGDSTKGSGLFLWNITVSAAFFEIISVAEVAMRNAMHNQLTIAFGSHWFSSRDIFDDRSVRAFNTAWQQLRLTSGTLVTSVAPGKFVGELSFGGWTSLLDAGGWHGRDPLRIRCDYENTLWRPCLHSAFPNNRRGTRKPVHVLARQVQMLRNRIAHHEPLLWGVPDPHSPTRRNSLNTVHDQVISLVRFVDKDVSDWLISVSQVPALLTNPPNGAVGLNL